MKNSGLILFIFCTISFSLFAQEKGGLSKDHLEKIKQAYEKNTYDKAITNAVSNNKIRDLALNRDNAGKTDHHFNYKVDVSGITDQKQSGRCWMFTGLNVVRPKVINHYNLSSFEFSTNYLYFYDQLEKANLFMEGIIHNADLAMDDRLIVWFFKSPVGDGGVWNSFTNLVEKYGLVPASAMPETQNSENTYILQKLIKRKLREQGLALKRMMENKEPYETVENKKVEYLSEIYRMLVIGLGEPPAEFEWRYEDKDGNLSEIKTYTPVSFFNECLNTNFDDYVMLMDDPSRPYGKLYEIEFDRNVMEGRNWIYVNIPSKKIKKFAVASIKENEAMYFSCDVGKQLNKDEGVLSMENYDYESLFGVSFNMDKKDRILTRESGSSHGMALVGVDTDENDNPKNWLLENSWGSSSGHNGYLTMTDEWFDEYMFRVVVLKQFIDKETLKILEQKPVKLKPWDPMFQYDD